MIKRLPRRTRRFVAIGAFAVVATLGWYAMQPVHPPCITFSGRYLPLENLSQDGAFEANRELDARAYQQAVESGHCEPPHARWHGWRG
ncbi:hypothetical protein [Streptomyces sp. NRRL S-4]|uniref:hypothetical protein n=1 Tax=Streptomyces sp. NRRL S-4 TaxID=1519471 RepID=UPI0006B6589F|nr:hypothetical protein [Streptomyces sp. NRRL S-4]KPC78701.1 hypothetical protein ADK82_28435 [Streptomyces sp. NRRL S-4]